MAMKLQDAVNSASHGDTAKILTLNIAELSKIVIN